MAREGPVLLGCLAPSLQLGLCAGEVGEDQFELEDGQVLERVAAAGYVRVLEGPQHDADGVGFADPAQEPVPEPLPRRCPSHQARDVDKLDAGMHDLLRGAHNRQSVQAVVWHLGDPGCSSRSSRTGGWQQVPRLLSKR